MDSGVYRIASLQSSSQVMNVASGSTSNGANIEIYKNNETYNQRRWYLDNKSSYYILRNVRSNKTVHLEGHKAANKKNIKQWAYENANWQRWTISSHTSNKVKINGVEYTPVSFRSKVNSAYALDRTGGKYTNSTNVQLYKYNSGTKAQMWVMIKDTRYQSMAVPTNVGLADSTTGAAYVNKACYAASTTFYPCWKCSSGSTWQLRWRWRGRKTNTNDWSGWTRWYSNSNNSAVTNKSDADEGWGNAWTYNVSAGVSNNLYHSTQGIGVNVDQGTYDKKELQLEVRKFIANNATLNGVKISSHGASCTSTIKCIYKPSPSCAGITFTPSGLSIPIESDFKRNGNTVKINYIKVDGKTLLSNYKRDKYNYTGDEVEVPLDRLAFIPVDGSSASMQIQFSTVDYTWTYNLSPTINYTSSHGLTLNPTFTSTDGWMELATVGNYTDKHCWILVENDGRNKFSECETDSAGRFIIAPPLGVEYQVFITAESSSGWGSYSEVRPAIDTCKYVLFNHDDGYAVLPWNVKIDWGLERDTEIVQTQGRDFESVYFGNGSSRQITITGDLLLDDGIANSDFSDFAKLSVTDYAVVRFPYGERFDVAIEKVAFSAEYSRWRSVTITCREVS